MGKWGEGRKEKTGREESGTAKNEHMGYIKILDISASFYNTLFFPETNAFCYRSYILYITKYTTNLTHNS